MLKSTFNKLVICPVGIQSLHRLWCTNDRQFDVLLICYNEEAYNTYKNDGDYAYFQKGYKYPLIKEYLKKEGINHDYYCFIDDDTGIDAKGLNQMFEFMETTGVKVLHPAIEPKHQPNKLIRQNPDTEFRFATWTELQCLFMDYEYLTEVLDLFSTNKSGWGLPELFLNKTQTPFCIYDLVTVQHCRNTNSGIEPLYESVQSAFNEFEEAIKDIEFSAHKETGRKYKNLLSFPIIFSKEKAHYLMDCIKSIPEGSEIILVETIKDDVKNGIEVIERAKNRVLAKYYYQKFNYSEARNAAKSLSTRHIIFSLDSDERLLTHQHNDIIKAALELYKSDFGGLQVRNVSVIPELETLKEGRFKFNASEQARIFKNYTMFNWFGSVHEVIDKSIVDNGYSIADSNIFIHHVGYETSAGAMLEKAKARVEMLVDSGLAMNDEHYFKCLINEANNYKIWESIIKENN